uniref:Meiosis-specific nuclear structural protein 1 n=1 Tax=Cyprinus carpio TaxID=7962 RepID=A0A8C1VSN9_CYPCA
MSSVFHELGNRYRCYKRCEVVLLNLQETVSLQSFMSQQRNISHSRQQKMMLESRKQEEMRENQTKRIARDKQLQVNIQCEDRVEKKRFLRKMQDEEYGQQIQESILKAEEDRQFRERQLEQEERMAKELARINNEKLRDEKMRQYIKENSGQHRWQRRKPCLLFSGFAYCEFTSYQRQEQELERQLEEKERKRQEAYEEFLKEKLMVDEIVRKIYEEDQRELQLRLEKVVATQRYIEDFKKQQAEWRHLEREKVEAENRRIIEFAHYQQRKEEDRMAKVREREQAKENLHKMLSEQIEMEKREREKMERVREELHLEEQAEAARRQEIEEMEKRIRQRLELQKTCQEMMAFKQLRIQAEKEEEKAFRQMMMAKFAEDDRTEQMNAQKRRMKQLEHKRAVEKLLEERRQQYLAEQEREEEERAMEKEREAQRRKIIEEERQRLLKQHATKLLGYLPKGIFKEDDLEHFDEDFKNNFKQRQADIFSDEGWGDDSQ